MPIPRTLTSTCEPTITEAAARMAHSFDVFKVAGNGEPVLIEVEPSLGAAMARIIALREIFPGDYVIVSRTTGRRVSFTAQGRIQRS